MVFSSLSFLFLFLPGVLIAYFLLRGRAWRNVLLLGVSLVFYAWGEPVYVLLMIGSILANWLFGLLIGRSVRWRRCLLGWGVFLNLLAIGLFKYTGFFAETLHRLVGMPESIPRLALPIGISFYTFQAISYLMDVYRRDVCPQRNPIYFGTYIAMFSQLIAGPIVRYATIEDELRGRRESLAEFASGLRRFAVGLGKKVLIANTLGQVADTLIDAGPHLGALSAWTAFLAYFFQIYFDFSGYSDMAIGLGRIFGFHFLENFNYPYIARSVTDFWRRWHISLSTFFRDYVYIPLGGNRVSRGRWTFNFLLVWMLTGLWHGAGWNFVCWGVYYGLFLLLEKLLLGRVLAACPAVFQHAYVLLVCLFGWVLFRIERFADIGDWILALLGKYGMGHPAILNGLGVLQDWPWFIVAAIASTPLLRNAYRHFSSSRLVCVAADLFALFICGWSVLELVQGGFNPFIYYRF